MKLFLSPLSHEKGSFPFAKLGHLVTENNSTKYICPRAAGRENETVIECLFSQEFNDNDCREAILVLPNDYRFIVS